MSVAEDISEIATLLRTHWPEAWTYDDSERLAELLRHVPVLRLAHALEMRSSPYWDTGYTSRYWASSLSFRSRGRDGWAALAAATLDRSGYVREAAVQLLGKSRAPEGIPFLVLRTADWVPQVSQSAELALEALLSHCSDAELLAGLEVAFALEGRRRGVTSLALSARAAHLGDAFVCEMVEGKSAGAARWGLRVLRDRNSPLLVKAVRLALHSPAVALRFDAVRATSRLPFPERVDLLELAARDRLGSVRRAAFEDLSPADVSSDLLNRALVDTNSAIRLRAQRLVEQRGADAGPVYRRLLDSPHALERAVALLGLGEVGHPEDAAEAVVRIDDPSWRVRRAALRCMARLSPPDASEAALSALDDGSRKVLVVAAALARRRPDARLEAAAEVLGRSVEGARRKVGIHLLSAGRVEHEVAVLTSLLAVPEARADALDALASCLFTRVDPRDRLPAELDLCVKVALAAYPLPEDYSQRLRVTQLRERILFALRVSANGP